MINVYISYDYELCWGVWDKLPASYARSHVMRANEAARALIAVHREYQVPASWAIVGAMLETVAPEEIMQQTQRSADTIGAFRTYLEQLDPAHTNLFRADDDVIAALRDDPLLEPASHTFSHVYALEEEPVVLEDDFERFAKVFGDTFKTTPVSLVFPKNQSTETAIEIARSHGFQVMRVNPLNWLYEQRVRAGLEAKAIRILRFLDAFLPIQECFADRAKDRDPELCVGQYFLRPVFRTKLQDVLHLGRLKLGLAYCKFRGRPCHFWTHPHNFGSNPERSVANARHLFSYLKQQEQLGLIKLCRMSDWASSKPAHK